MNFKLKGVIVPMVTPFDQHGQLDQAAVGPLVDYLIGRGVAGIFPAGTTGEGFLLSLEERRQLAETVVEEVAGRVPVVVHTGAITTADTLALTQHAQAIGAQAAAIIPPFVFRHRDEVLLVHYVTIAQSVPDFPIYLYNYPGISNNTLTTELVLAIIKQAPNVIGMKDSSGSLETLIQVAAATEGRFNAINGGDPQILMALVMGFDGCVSGNANVFPELIVALYQAATAGDLMQARLLQRKLNQARRIVSDSGDLSLFKAMMARRGIPVGAVRAPLLQAPAAKAAECWQALTALDLGITWAVSADER